MNAITDVPGVEVGYKTLVSGEGKLVVGKGPVRTGVTAVLTAEAAQKLRTALDQFKGGKIVVAILLEEGRRRQFGQIVTRHSRAGPCGSPGWT